MRERFNYLSPLGTIVIIMSDKGLCELYFDTENKPSSGLIPDSFTEVVRWLDDYFEGKVPEKRVPLDLHVSDFCRRVLMETQKIPYGKTISYKDLAEQMEHLYGKRCSPRAIGQAMHRNPVCLMIPCHRVIFSDGRIGGYSHGTQIKKALLELERKNL